MKKGIHPETYRLVAFKDMSNETVFITRSCAPTKETIMVEGVEYPVVKLEISNDWVDIDYVEFKALGSPSSGDSSTMAMDVRFNRAEVEGSYELFDLQGNRVMRFNAHGMDDAVRMVKDGISGVRQGVYLVRRPGNAGLTRKVVVGSF